MTENAIARLLPDGSPDGGMKPMGHIADERGHTETYTSGDAFVIPRGFNGSFKMPGNFKNNFMTVEPER